MDRRDWLRLAVAQAAGALVPSLRAQGSVKFDGDPFALSVASGHPTAASVVLWTRLMPLNPMRNPWGDLTVPVVWELALDEHFAQPVRRGQTAAPPELAHSVHVEVEGLQPDQGYFYRFKAGDMTSPTGRTRTLPAPGARMESLRLAFASCQRYHAGYFSAYDHMLADAPDLVVFLGDYIYEMGATTTEVRGTWLYAASKLADYRLLYELARSDPSLQRMHAACPWLVTWDDHEVMNDYTGGEVRAGRASGRVAARMAMGYQAWYEHMPVSPRALTQGMAGLTSGSQELRIWGGYDWGDLARLHVLDTRQYRSPLAACGSLGMFDPKACEAAQDPARTMLGKEQEAWLLESLRAGGAEPVPRQWNLLCQPMVFSRFLLPVMGNVVMADNWDGYAVARQRILQACLTHRTRNPVVFGGDIHQNWVSHVALEAGGKEQLVMPEFCGTSISTDSLGPMTAAEMKALAPHCIYTDRHKRGYLLAQLRRDALEVALRAIDNPRQTRTEVSTLARFRVDAGNPQIRSLSAA